MITLTFDRGSIIIHGNVSTPYGQWDPRINTFRAMAMFYPSILSYLNQSQIPYVDNVLDIIPTPQYTSTISLRPYQIDALNSWLAAGRRGVIVLPTAAGKTYIAIKAIELLNVPTLIVVPTLDLLDQWKQLLLQQFKLDIGVYGGGDNFLKPITVSTYDSAYLKAEKLGNKFLLLIFDEVHHLPAPSYSQIAEMSVAPYRLGLTATYEREDGRHTLLPQLVGDCVYELSVDALAGKHLAPYVHEKVFVELTPEEQEIYQQEYSTFINYLQDNNIVLRSSKDFQKFIIRTGSDPKAREALLARNTALKTALNSESKLKSLAKLLKIYSKNKIIIFTRHNQLVYRISRRFLVPAITHKTNRVERQEILEKFKHNEYRVLVTSQVLDEGVDVPDASVGIILSGTGSSREYIQRLGRLLRKRDGKQAKIIEIIAKGTIETRISNRRHK